MTSVFVSAMTVAEVRALPAVVSVPVAGRAFGLGRDLSYDLARTGEFPVPVLRLGTALRVTRGSLLVALGIPDNDEGAGTTPRLANTAPSTGAITGDQRTTRRSA